MKIYVHASSHGYSEYEKVNPNFVTLHCLMNSELISKLPSIDSDILNLITKCIVDWKQRNEIIYHHADMNTSNNVGHNIIMITASAHGYLHNSSIIYALQDKFNLANTPTYPQGEQAKSLQVKTLKILGEVLDFSKYSLQNVIDVMCSRRIIDKINSTDMNSYTSRKSLSTFINRAIDSMNFSKLEKSSIYSIVNQFILSTNKSTVPDVSIIDDDTAYNVINILEGLLNKRGLDGVTRTSLEAIKSFISNNKSARTIIEYNYRQTLDKKLRAN